MRYDPNTPRIAQTDSWSCSVASTTWLLRSLGIDAAYLPMEQRMVREGLVSSDLGLLDGSGTRLAFWLADNWGLEAKVGPVTWADVTERAGRGPLIMGGHGWYHWVGVRCYYDGVLELANPADGWKGVYQTLDEQDFRRLGPFSAVYVPVSEDDPVQVAELTTRLGYLQGDVADALQSGLDGARAAEDGEQLEAAYEALQAAINTLRAS